MYGDLLNRKNRTDFQILVRELKHRCRKIETSHSHRENVQQMPAYPCESEDDYAVELKRLYNKVHSNRVAETRRQDLLRRFVDGIVDESARFHVEYTKEPYDVDGAAFEVVNCFQTRRFGDRDE